MNIFRNKFLVKLIASICIFLTLINMGIPNMAYAAGDDPVWGGVLINPVTKLLTALADGIMAILHKAILEERVSLVTISGNPSWWDKVGSTVISILIGAVTVVVCAVILICSYGTAAPAAFAIAGVAVGAVEVISSAVLSLAFGGSHNGLIGMAGTIVAKKIGNWVFDRDIFLPVFQLAPDRIFSNQIPMFDINFFNPNKYYVDEEIEHKNEEVFYVIDYTADVVNNVPEDWRLAYQKTDYQYSLEELEQNPELEELEFTLCYELQEIMWGGETNQHEKKASLETFLNESELGGGGPTRKRSCKATEIYYRRNK